MLEWITERRLAEARRLLLETDMGVEDLGLACGFGDPTHFIVQFRKNVGQTPAAWRRSLR
ncbi:hypothetical protein GCM10008938_43250 [Deinococcus roseus]|uniref:HTH araC/xylS-type domain-containing protein n=1 Tax=Deinococcus roseus TaxID=392414 RepID=A0ABQ2DBH6_9DEIO|nr:hypothetical protein GCM10008938_43250 [Deinococcus roseus]